MKEDSPILYPNERVGERIGDYSKTHTTGLHKHIVDYHDRSRETMPKTANFMISISQTQAMLFLARVFGAKRDQSTSRVLPMY